VLFLFSDDSWAELDSMEVQEARKAQQKINSKQAESGIRRL